MSDPRLLVVFASTRPARGGWPIFSWFVAAARAHGGFDVHEVDLADVALPLFDEDEHPRFGRYAEEHTLRWKALVEPADAFVFVTPEYNWSFPAALKNALDFLGPEWRHKPVGFVSYGGVSAGTRSVTAIRPVVNALGMTATVAAINVPFYAERISNGVFEPNEVTTNAVAPLLEELRSYVTVLAPLRRTGSSR